MFGAGVLNVYAESVPDWVKNTAGWWATDAISEIEFVNAIEFLVNQGIINVSGSAENELNDGIPDWVKNTAGWWATDAISEIEFVNAIEFLVNIRIINIESNEKCVNDFLKYFDNKQKIIEVCDEYKNYEFELRPYDVEINFNEEGFRNIEFNAQKSNDVYRIFMVGGSTMFGSGSTDSGTIPFLLQKMIDSQEIDLDVEIINAGVSGGNSSTERTLIETKLIDYSPNLIIMYDGWNDLSADYPVKKITMNYNSICKLAKEQNFDVMIALQPIAGFGNKVLTEQEKINSLTGQDHNGFQLLQAKSTYDWLERESEILIKNSDNNACTFHDLRNTFDDISGPIYWDQGHMSDAGNLILADRFLKELSKTHPNTFSYNEKFYNIIKNYNHPSITKLIISELGINVDYSNVSYKDITNSFNAKGNYFELKEKSGIEGILVGKDLRNVDLNSINLKGNDLTGANLSGHPGFIRDLRNVDFTNTIIRDADLSYTNLEGKSFSGIDIRGIDFSNANLKNADFTGASVSKTLQDFSGKNDDLCKDIFDAIECTKNTVQNESIRINFSNADLTNAKFGSLEGDPEKQMVNFADFTNATLTDVNLENVKFIGADFTNAKLNNIVGEKLIFAVSDFTNVEMNNFKFSDIWFMEVLFDNSEMKNGEFDSISAVNVSFKNTDLDETLFIESQFAGSVNMNCKNNTNCN